MKVPEGLERFVESVGGVAISASDDFLRESTDKAPSRVREAVASGEGWWVPISFYNKKNLNGRNYGKKLWERVRDKQRKSWYGSSCLCDHPAGDSDGNPKDICGVWLDMRLGEPDRSGVGLVWALLVPSGANGENLRDFLKKGGRIGTSSSGFGRLMDDGETVDPDTYQIDRCADWVMCPSQSTYFGIDDEGQIEDRSIRESLEKPIEYKAIETTTNYIENNSKENKMSTMSKMEEKKFRKDIESFLTEATSIQNAQERLEEYKEIESYFAEGTCADLKEKVEAKIAETAEYIKRAVAEKAELKESFGIEDPKDLQRKLTRVVNESKLNEREARDWKDVAEKMQEKCKTLQEQLDSRHSDAYVEYLKGKLDKANSQITTLTESSKEQIEDLTNRVNQLNEQLEASNLQNKELQESASATETKLQEGVASSSDLQNKLTEATQMTESLNSKVSTLEEENAKLKMALEEMKARQSQVIKGAKVLKESLEKKSQENQKLEESKQKLQKKEATRKFVEKRQHIEEAKTEQERYFESLVKLHGEEVEKFQEAIEGAKSIEAAKNYYWRIILPSLGESDKLEKMRLPESYTVSKKDREEAFKDVKFRDYDILEHLPKDWV